ncbi:hypothetical protein GGI12_001649 [Dipsacomyces acuminosporus]|nr:hypothetical protein GGI12_001649 [Dipsacomyces acuminosporus]
MRFLTYAPVFVLATFAAAAPIAQGPVDGAGLVSVKVDIGTAYSETASAPIEVPVEVPAVKAPTEPQVKAPAEPQVKAIAEVPAVANAPAKPQAKAPAESVTDFLGKIPAAAAAIAPVVHDVAPVVNAVKPLVKAPVKDISREDVAADKAAKKAQKSRFGGILHDVGSILKNPKQVATDIDHIIHGRPSTYKPKEDLTKLPGFSRLARCGIPASDIQAAAPIYDHIKTNVTTDGIETLINIVTDTVAGAAVGQGPFSLALSIAKEVTRGIKITDIDFPKLISLIRQIIEKQQCIVPHA